MEAEAQTISKALMLEIVLAPRSQDATDRFAAQCGSPRCLT